jgi:hypothetical protein
MNRKTPIRFNSYWEAKSFHLRQRIESFIFVSEVYLFLTENWIIHVRRYRHGKRVISNIIQGSVRRVSNFSTFSVRGAT